MKNLTEGNISKNLLLFAIPIIISGVIGNAYNLIDTIIVGKYIGEHGLAALGSTSAFLTIISSVMWGLGTGIATYIGSIMGSGNYKKMVNEIKANMCLVLGLAMIISILSILLYKPIFLILSISGDIYSDAHTYYTIYLSGFIFMAFNACSVYIFGAMGNTSFPMKMSAFAGVGNVVGNVLLIAVFGMGVAGAAIATIGVSCMCSICYMLRLHFEFKKLGITRQKIHFDKSEITKAWKQGVPGMIQQAVMYFSSVCVQPSINILGSSAIAGYSVCMQIYNINTAVFYNSSKSINHFCAQCVGGKKVDLVQKGFNIGLRQSLLLTIPVMAVLMLFPDQIVNLFFNDATVESVGYVKTYIYLCIPFVLCQVLNNLFHNFFRGVLMPKIGLFTTFVYSVVRIIATYSLVPFFKMNGVFFGLIISWVAEVILCFYIYHSNSWKSEWYLNMERECKYTK